MTLPLGPKADLLHLLEKLPETAQAARGRLLGILAYIEHLEAELAIIEANRRMAGYARAESLTPARRREIAIQAGKRLKATSQDESLPLTEAS